MSGQIKSNLSHNLERQIFPSAVQLRKLFRESANLFCLKFCKIKAKNMKKSFVIGTIVTQPR